MSLGVFGIVADILGAVWTGIKTILGIGFWWGVGLAGHAALFKIYEFFEEHFEAFRGMRQGRPDDVVTDTL